MNRRLVWLCAVAALLVSSPRSLAFADDMDVTLQRLRIPAAEGTPCSPTASNGTARDFCADGPAWNRVMSQLGAAVATPVLSPARTLGPRGFYVGFESWMSNIDSSSGGANNYWRLGTEGDEASGAEGRNRYPASLLAVSRVAVRKGFPFGFELGTSIGHLWGTSHWALGAELKWALFEGFRTGIGYLPDFAVRASAQVLTGNAQFSMVVPTLDAILSKPLVIGHMGTITPYLGVQMLWIFADSELIDLTSDVDAQSPGHGADLNNNVVFPRIRLRRYRAAIGVQGRYEAFTGSLSFHFDMLTPHSADSDAQSDLPRQWTLSLAGGVSF